ncbi:MAG: hypothetical protein R3C44_05345 [Chloroflexota bacterium]
MQDLAGHPLAAHHHPELERLSSPGVHLDSLQAQTVRTLRQIVADNGSTDGSLAFLQENYPDVRVVALGENRVYRGPVTPDMQLLRATPSSSFSTTIQKRIQGG